MANLITADDDLFSAYVNGGDRAENRSFLARQWDRVSNVITDRGRQFMEKARSAFESYDTDLVSRGLRAIKRRLDTRWSETDIRSLGTIGELQNASVKMQRWLMANTRVRKEHHHGRCHGWDDSYVDLEPGLWGEQHSDYRRVMNGMAVVDEDGSATYTTYFDAFEEDGEEELSFLDQCDIIRSWENLEVLLDAKLDDPTDPNNGAL